MTDLFEKSMETLELPRVLSLLADQAVTEEGKERARRLRPETDPAEVALRLKETTAAVNKMELRGSPSFSGVKPVAGSLQRADMGGSLSTRELLDIACRNAKEEVERVTSDAERTAGILRLLQELAGLPVLPRRMESYDISHTGGADQVASMVVFVDGRPLKRDYRRFQIQSCGGPDDYGAMAEVLERRFRRYLDGDGKFSPLPDLLLIDGGVQHARVAEEVAAKLHLSVPVLGMVKDDRHRTRALVTAQGMEIGIQTPPALFALIGRVQEEVHRFAITYHHQKHAKNAYRSQLDGIAGVGEARKRLLLQRFGTVKAIRAAELLQLEEVLPKPAARAVYDHFHPENMPKENTP